MSKQKFDDNCPGCRPVILDAQTMKKFPDDHPMMVAANKGWSQTTREEREGFHDFTCLNSRAPQAVQAMVSVTKKMEAELKKLPT